MSRADNGAVGAWTVQDRDVGQGHAAVLATHVVLSTPRPILHQPHVGHIVHGRSMDRLALKHCVLVVDCGFGEPLVGTVKQRFIVATGAVQQTTENVSVTGTLQCLVSENSTVSHRECLCNRNISV